MTINSHTPSVSLRDLIGHLREIARRAGEDAEVRIAWDPGYPNPPMECAIGGSFTAGPVLLADGVAYLACLGEPDVVRKEIMDALGWQSPPPNGTHGKPATPSSAMLASGASDEAQD